MVLDGGKCEADLSGWAYEPGGDRRIYRDEGGARDDDAGCDVRAKRQLHHALLGN
jgi:hypothetical protein